MAGASLLLLLDDISLLMDDVSVMTKVAAKKTVGVLGDDLALNADQVTGVKPSRELAVIWAVTKGSFVNKLILVPVALVISYFVPNLITPLLMLGGSFLCYEGAEKVIHKFWPRLLPHDPKQQARREANINENIDLVKFENQKIKGAIRTDFILSAEILVISLSATAAANATLLEKSLVLSIIAIAVTVGVYGLVAIIVKIDDLGLHLIQKDSAAAQSIGQVLIAAAPKLMKFLSIAGTIAMFLVGGGIIVHGIHYLQHLVEGISQSLGLFEGLVAALLHGIFGFIIGAVLVAVMMIIAKMGSERTAHS